MTRRQIAEQDEREKNCVALAASFGVEIVVHRYAMTDRVRRDVWELRRGDTEIGHYVPGTRRYRLGNEIGGPKKFATVLRKIVTQKRKRAA